MKKNGVVIFWCKSNLSPTIQPLIAKNIPINVKNTFKPKDKGYTLV